MKKILVLLLFTTAAMAQDGLKISGQTLGLYKSLYSDSHDTAISSFELLLSKSLFWFEYQMENETTTFQNFDANKRGYCNRCPELQNDKVVPVPLKMNNPGLLYQQLKAQTRDTFHLGNTVPSEVLDSVGWSFKASNKGMRYEMSAYLGADFQHEVISYSVDTLYKRSNLETWVRGKPGATKTLTETTSTGDGAASKNPPPKAISSGPDKDSLYHLLKEKTGNEEAVFIFWFKGCLACTRLILELNKKDIPKTKVVLINTLNTNEATKSYLSKNAIRFSNFCIATEGINAYPTSLFVCPLNPGKTCVEVGYDQRILATIQAVLQTR